MYNLSIVTFIDILGFRDLVLKTEPEKIMKILNLVEHLSGAKDDNYEYSPSVLCFSDSIVRVRQVDSKANKQYPVGLLFHELLSLLHIQGELVHFGVQIRGAVTIGHVSVSSNKIFGPAFIEAYEIESKYTQYPRISLSPKLLRSIDDCRLVIAEGHSCDEEKDYIRKILRLGDDGIWFIDYLYGFQNEVDEPDLYYQFLVKHKKNILMFAHHSDDSITSRGVKCSWLAQYQNRRIEDLPEKWFEHYGVKREELMVLPNELPSLYYL